jgi:hypothetical protein
MTHLKVSLGFCTVLACGLGVVAASAQQLNPEQIQQIEYVTSFVCTTVKQQKGSTSREQLQADVNAKIGGIVGKVIPLGAGVQGSVSNENYEGLSRDATATALEGDRGCRERVFNTMFDRFNVRVAEAVRGAAAAPATAPATSGPSVPTIAPTTSAAPAPTTSATPVTTSTECVVNNPSGRPMNVRETPNGAIKGSVNNRAHVRPLRFASAADGKPWAYVSDVTGREIGWMFSPFLNCSGPGRG